MGMTIAEKILASHAGKRVVRPGDVVVVNVDVAVDIDAPFAGPGMHPNLTKVFDPEKVVVVADHLVPAPTIEAANGLKRMREFVKKFGIKHYFPEGTQGISHVLVAEHGLALPGQILACADSHTCSSGALNCLARGLGSSEMIYVICKGQTWFVVGPTTKVFLEGALPEHVYPRDVIHYIGGRYGDFANRNLEWGGEGLANIGMGGRLTMATMSAEVSVEFSLFPYDAVTEAYLKGRARWPYEPAFADADAVYEQELRVDLSSLEPQVVLPGKVPHNAAPVRDVAGTRIDQAFIGSCANGTLDDLELAAEILDGRRVSSKVRLIITPASQMVYREALKSGVIARLIDAGAVVTPATCGACGGGHLGVLGPNETCITATTRNFKGRMGDPSAKIYMASPATVAASAITGTITDPREFLQ